MSNGWIKLHRSFWDWEWADDPKMVSLFIYCISRANHTDKQWRGVDIKRGQFYTSYASLSTQTGLSIRSLRTCFDKLKATGEASRSKHAKGLMVTVVNYDKYQLTDTDCVTVASQQRHSNGTQTTTTKNEKKEKNEKKLTLPSEAEFIEYLLEAMPKANPEWTSDRINRAASQQFETYVEDGWKDGFGKPIKNWKTKAKNCLTHKKPWSYGKATGTKTLTPEQMRGY